MKRLSKEKCNGTLEGATLSSETGFIKIQFKKEEWNLESFDEKISTFSKDISKGKLILTLKETDLSYMYELKFEEKIEIKEEVKMTTTNIFEKDIITFLINNGPSSAKRISEYFNKNITTTKLTLYSLVDKGLVKTEGTIKNKKYFVKE